MPSGKYVPGTEYQVLANLPLLPPPRQNRRHWTCSPVPTLLAQPTWVMLDLGVLVLGGLCVLAPLGVLVWGLTLLVRSGGRMWRPMLLVALGCLLAWFLFPALYDYRWIRTVFHPRIVVPGTIGCLGVICIALGLRTMLGFPRPR